MKYSEVLKNKIRSEYKPFECGYKQLARKYGLTRDAVRGIILGTNRRGISSTMPENEKPEFKTKEEELEYYKTAAMYFEAYARRLEINIAEDLKKKSRVEAVHECKQQGAKVKSVCKVAKIARSSLYYFNSHSHVKDEKDLEVLDLIKSLDVEDQKLGSKTKARVLSQKEGKSFNHKRIARICKKYGLLSPIRKAKVPSGYYKQIKEQRQNQNGNVLNREFRAKRPGAAFAADISYFKVKEGWMYLSAIKDLFNGEIVASLCSRKCNTDLATETLKQLRGKKHFLNALLHSDLGSTYVSRLFLEECNFQGFVKSFSRKGNCWDNACMESFFGTVKCETGYYDALRTKLWTYKEAEQKVLSYIERYNNKRIQKKLGWLSPVEYRKKAA